MKTETEERCPALSLPIIHCCFSLGRAEEEEAMSPPSGVMARVEIWETSDQPGYKKKLESSPTWPNYNGALMCPPSGRT